LILNQAFPSGSYQMTVTDGNGCIIDTTVIVNSPPEIIPSFTASTYEGVYPLPVNFTNTTSGASGYSWDFGDGGTSVDFSPNYTFTEPGDYTVILTAQDGPCSGSTTQLIIVINESSVDVPNVITVNGDGMNELFTVNVNSIETYKINILNRWGRVLFESTDPSISWDATNKGGNKVAAGTYFYVIEATGFDTVEHKKSGHVTVFDN
jgi:gliding motility-associated-like protein